MFSLQNYFAKGIGIAAITLIIVLGIYVLAKCLPQLAGRKVTSIGFMAVLWYFLTLEAVSLMKVREAFVVSVRAYNLTLFAWVGNCFTQGITSLWQIALNFAMYAPLGMIFAHACKGKKRPWLRLPLMILSVSIANELIQYIFALGIADIDDLLANTLGGLWGSALYYLWERLRAKRRCTGPAIAAAAPLLIACAACVFYIAKPYGYLPTDFNIERRRVNSLDCAAIADDFPDAVTVYKTHTLSREEMKSGSEALFAAFGQKINPDTELSYEDLVVYYGQVQQYYSWFWDSGFFTFSTMEHGVELDGAEDAPDEQMYALLRKMGIDLPPATSFETGARRGYETYQLNYDFVEHEGHSYHGTVSWEMKENRLYELAYSVLELSSVDDFPAKERDAVCGQLEKGRFWSESLAEKTVDELVCLGCELEFMTDSKGFYRPVYAVRCMADGEPVELIIDAIK